MRWDVSDLDRVSGVGSKLREGGARLIKIFVKAKKMSLVMVIYKFAKQGEGLNQPPHNIPHNIREGGLRPSNQKKGELSSKIFFRFKICREGMVVAIL